MALEVNRHVSRLRRFQPFHPDSAELVYELSDPNEAGFDTRVIEHLLRVIEDDGIRLIILTGDAGHGKTTLCAQLLQRLGASPTDAAEAIRQHGDGRHLVGQSHSGRGIRMVRDLSEFTVEHGAGMLLDLADSADRDIAIVCANEGRLRHTAAHGGPTLRVLTETVERGVADGTLHGIDPAIHVVNLNFQSVAPDQARGLTDWALRTWAADGRSWRICGRCDASEVCPIFKNHRLLTDADAGARRRGAVRELFAMAERSGAVVTTRQALASLALAISGGMTCPDVHRRWQRAHEDRSWQYPYLFHQALFADHLSREKRAQVPAIASLRKLDPGSTALRHVDDVLEAVADADEFLPPTPSEEGTPRSRRDARRDSESTHQLMRFLRRRDFFDAPSGELGARMGLQAGTQFAAAAIGEVDEEAVATRDRLLRGLEAVQGVHRAGQPADFLVLDPAFVTHRSRAAVIARRMRSRQAQVLPQIRVWTARSGADERLDDVLDWLNRLVYLRFADGRAVVDVPLDLTRFELLTRWASGLSSRGQHEAEVRRFSSLLSRLVADESANDEIMVLVGMERRSLTIDVGDRVRSGEG